MGDEVGDRHASPALAHRGGTRNCASVCDAWAAGTHVKPCYEPCRQDGFIACPAGTLCDVDARDYPGCPGTVSWGRCVTLPADCAGASGGPVCGCDRSLHPNDCARVRAGTSLAVDALCPR